MFENIVSKDGVKFKDLEEIIFKIACSIANEMFKNILEDYDKKLMDTRDKQKYRHKGLETTTLKTKTGLVEYTRVKYQEIKEDGTKKCVYLTDEALAINNKVGQVSEGLIELIIQNISELSYRACADIINNSTGITITGVAVWNIVQEVGEKIKEIEAKKVEAHKEEKLEKGTKETPTIYQEADGVMIVMQGKDREKRIKEYKKEHPNEEVPKKVRNGELKLGMTYEGWKKIGKNRYELVGKEYVSGFMTGEEMAKITNANLYAKYDMEKVEIRVANSDGARWIKKLEVKGMIYQADYYHLKEKINTHVREEEDAKELIKMFWKEQFKEMIEYVESLKYKYDGECEEVEKLEELKKYLEKRKENLKRYNSSKEVKRKLKGYSEKTGLVYRNMGCQESNNYAKITRRFKRRRMSWSEEGATNLAKVITTYASESCKDIFEYMEIKLMPESFIEYAERYVNDIEENIRKIKTEGKGKKKINREYTFKQGSLEGYPNLKKILENKEISELIYR